MNLKAIKLGVLCLSVILFAACATTKKKVEEGAPISSESGGAAPDSLTSMRVSDVAPPEILVPEFDNVPEAVSPSVEKWIQYFKGKGREHMERYLSRSTRYSKLMKQILRQNNLPEDLIYIALIESGFSPRAISRAAAVGYWQFIRGTGKHYGLQINSFVDERRDPEIATQAAADYFKVLYSEFNSWFLAMASYNVGEGRVRREIRRNKTNDFWVLAKKRRIPKETVNYVPKYLAARMIAKNPEKYGFIDIPYETPIEFETVTLNNPVNIRKMAEKMNIDYPELKRLNPKFRGEVAILDEGKIIMRVPLATTEIAKTAAIDAAVNDIVFVADRGETDIYKVRPGDTLNRIARRFKASIGMIKDLNELKRGSRLQPGRTIFVPLRVTESAQWELAQRKPRQLPIKSETPVEQVTKLDDAIYIVQEKESLADIAEKNKLSMAELMELNSFSEGDAIKVGMQLRVKKLQPEQGEPIIEVALAQSNEVKPEVKAPPSEAVVGAGTLTAVPAVVPAAIPAVVPVAVAAAIPAAVVESVSIDVGEVPKKHTVKSGDSLYRIAKMYGTTVGAIKKANNFKRRKSRIHPGTILIIPENEEKSSQSQSKELKEGNLKQSSYVDLGSM